MNLYGHTHTDLFKVVTSTTEPKRPIGTLTICGSLTTWGGVNPSFCVYEVDAETFLPISRVTYAFDVI
jgi:hypothetical protein